MVTMMVTSLAHHEIYLQRSNKQREWLHLWHTVKYFCAGLHVMMMKMMVASLARHEIAKV